MIDEAEMKRLPERRQSIYRALFAYSAGLATNLGAGDAERKLDWRYFDDNQRRTEAPTQNELNELFRTQWKSQRREHGTRVQDAAAAAGLPEKTLDAIINGKRSPTYPTLIKAAAACGIDITVTMPGTSFPETAAISGGTGDVQLLLSRAPTFNELCKMVRSRLVLRHNENHKRLSVRRMEGLRNLPLSTIEQLLAGRQPTYKTLREILAALHIDLVVRPAGKPLPERLRYARFSEEKQYLPIVQLKTHDATTSIDGRLIRRAAAPADLEPDHEAFYVVWPYTHDTGTGLTEGDFCLVTPKRPKDHHQLVWIEMMDEARTQTPARMLRQSYRTISRRGTSLPLQAMTWRETEETFTRDILSIPISKLYRISPIVAAYDGRPTSMRPPQKRNL